MAKGYSLLIGVKEVDPIHYQGWKGLLAQPENDASSVKEKIQKYGFETKLLLTRQATRENVINGIKKAADKLDTGDLFFLYYSGHGGQVPDLAGKEEDGLNETWCLYDGQLIDDELYYLWSEFTPGVRIFVISDSCHSGTMTKTIMPEEETRFPEESPRNRLLSKNLPDYYIQKVFDNNKKFYEEIYEMLAALPEKDINVSVVLMSSSQDDQSSYAFLNDKHSLFTSCLLSILNDQKPPMSYKEVLENIRHKVKEKVGVLQSPGIYTIDFSEQQLLKI